MFIAFMSQHALLARSVTDATRHSLVRVVFPRVCVCVCVCARNDNDIYKSTVDPYDDINRFGVAS